MFVDVLVCTISLWYCLRSRRTRKYSSIPASDTPTVTPTPIPAFVLKLSPEVAISWSVGGLSDGGVVVLVGDTEVEIERAFVDRVSEELLVTDVT